MVTDVWNDDEYPASRGSSGDTMLEKFLDADEVDIGLSDLNDLDLELPGCNGRAFA